MSAAHRLSPLDAAFLYFERPNQLLHVGCLALLEASPPFEPLAASLGERLGRLERYHQRPVRPLLDLDLPRWEEDPVYTPRRHVRHVAVPPPGGEAELRALVDTLFATPFDPSHPLWEMYLIDGLAGGRAALLAKVHHAMLDGVSGAQVLELITDPPPGRVSPAPRPSAERSGRGAGLARAALDALRAALDPATLRARAGDAARAAGLLASFVREPAPGLPLNGSLSDARHIAWATFPLDDFLTLRGAAGCKVNDVVLAVITGGLRRYLLRRGVSVDGIALRALVPVDTRRDDEHLALGNRVSAMYATLPLGIADPALRLVQIAADTRARKANGESRATELAMALTALPALAPLIARWLPQRHLVNTICTNVQGPREARLLLGRKVLEIHPIVPLMLNIGTGFAIMSYAGQLSICVNTDAHLIPDAHEIPKALRESAAELKAALARPVPAPAVAAPAAATLVGDLMARPVWTVTPADSLAHAWALMRLHRIRHLPVVDGAQRLVGLVTHRDLLAAAASSLALPREDERVTLLRWHRVAEVMETHVGATAAEESAAAAGRRMVRHKIGCLPVVDAADQLVGIVTDEDFLRWATEQMAPEGGAPATGEAQAAPEAAPWPVPPMAGRAVR